jgi:hypothetical protein
MGGVPARLAEFDDAFVDLVCWNHEYLCGPGEYVHYPRPPKVSIHDVARNIMAESFRGEWLIMLDTDHAPEPDIAARLLKVADDCEADVVTAMYQYRAAPHSPVLYRHRGDGLYPLGAWDETVRAIEVDSAGAGCLFVRRRVFERIAAELGEQPFERIKHHGEDHSFFLRLRQLGIKTVCDPHVECPHLTVKPITLEDYRRQDVDLEEPETVRGYR